MGPKRVSFGIHKALLCHVSSYLKAALTGNFKEASERTVTLWDEKPEVFMRFNAWLYTNVIELEKDPLKPHWAHLMDLSVFAEKRGIPSLQNSVIDAMITIKSKVESLPPASRIEDVWEKTSETSGLHPFLVDFYVHIGREGTLKKMLKYVDGFSEILVEVILAFHRGKEVGSIVKKFDFGKKRCQYHIHEPDELPCKGPMPSMA